MSPVCAVTSPQTWRGREAERPQHADLARALELERHQRAEHADERHGDGEHAQHAGDREGAVEDRERGLAERAVGADEDVLPARGALAHGGHHERPRPPRGEIEREARDRGDRPRTARTSGGSSPPRPRSSRSRRTRRPRESRARRGRCEADGVAGARRRGDWRTAPTRPPPRRRRRPDAVRAALAKAPAGTARGVEVERDHLDGPARPGRERAARTCWSRPRPGVDARCATSARSRVASRAIADEARRGDVDVGAQRALEPAHHRLAEARDHDAHADGRRHRDHQRGDGDRGARQRGDDAARGHPAEDPEGRARDRVEQAQEQQRRARRDEGAAEHHDEESGEAARDAAARPRQDEGAAAEEPEHRRRPRASRHRRAPRLERGAAHHDARRGARRLERGRERGERRGADAEGGALPRSSGSSATSLTESTK